MSVTSKGGRLMPPVSLVIRSLCIPWLTSSSEPFIARRASVCSRRDCSFIRSFDTSTCDDCCLAGVLHVQLCPSLVHRPHRGCSRLHRTFLSLQLSQASRFPLPALLDDAGGERRTSRFACSEEPGLLTDALPDDAADGMVPITGLVHDEGSVLPADTFEDITKLVHKAKRSKKGSVWLLELKGFQYGLRIVYRRNKTMDMVAKFFSHQLGTILPGTTAAQALHEKPRRFSWPTLPLVRPTYRPLIRGRGRRIQQDDVRGAEIVALRLPRVDCQQLDLQLQTDSNPCNEIG